MTANSLMCPCNGLSKIFIVNDDLEHNNVIHEKHFFHIYHDELCDKNTAA